MTMMESVKDQVHSMMPSIMKTIESLRNMFPNSPIRIRFRFRSSESDSATETSDGTPLIRFRYNPELGQLDKVGGVEMSRLPTSLSLPTRIDQEELGTEEPEHWDSDEQASSDSEPCSASSDSEEFEDEAEHEQAAPASANAKAQEANAVAEDPAAADAKADVAARAQAEAQTEDEASCSSDSSSSDEPCPGCELCTPPELQQNQASVQEADERSKTEQVQADKHDLRILESAESDMIPMMPMKVVSVKEITTETCCGITVREVFLDDLPIILAVLMPLFALGYLLGKWLAKHRRENMVPVVVRVRSPRYSAHPSRTSILPIYNDEVTNAMEQTDDV